MSDSHDRDRDRQSLRDLAKLSQQTGPLSSAAPASSARIMPPPSSGVTDNSGLIDLERLSEAIRATNDAKSEASMHAPVSSAESVVPAPAPTAPSAGMASPAPMAASDLTPISPSVRLADAPGAEPASGPAVTSPPAAAAAPATAGASKTPLVAAALVLVAAGAFFATRKGEAPAPAPAPPVVEAAQPAASAASAASAEAPKPVEAAPAAEERAKAPVAPKVEAPKAAESPKAEEVPAVTAAPAEAAKAGAAKAPAGGAGAKPAASGKAEKSFADEMAAAVTGKLETKSQATEAAAAGPAGPAAGVAKPGTGQVSAAFAKVKGAAHGCLGGQEIEVKTTVTFGSDGKVTKVAVANAPDPGMAACIEGAVGKATVPPFTDPTFSAPLTVR